MLIKNTINIDIKEEEELVAKATVNTDGSINIEFTEFAANHSDVSGFFYIDTVFNRNNIGNGESEKIEFYLGGETQPVIVEVKFKQDPIPEASISKSGKYDGFKNEITWNIEFNKENISLKSVNIIDDIPLGQEYIEGSATIDNGADISGFSYVSVANDSNKAGTLIYNFQGEINKKHIISFKTKISDSRILMENQGKSINLYNSAILDINGARKESNNASVEVKVNYIEKSGKYVSNENGNKVNRIDWTIKINNNALKLNNLKIEDSIPAGLELINGTFKVNNNVNNGYTYTGNKLTYTFENEINTQQIITYSTNIVDEKVYHSNDTTNFKNTATIVEGVKSTPSASANVGVGSNILRKSALNNYDAANHYLTWKIEVNSNEVKLENPVVTDNIPVGQKYVAGSLKIDGLAPDTNKFNYKVSDNGDTEKTGTITYNFNETINKKYVITFKTEVTESSIYAGNINGKQYSNTAYMKADNILKEVNSKANQNVTSNVIEKKSESYDFVNKEITWKIFVNKNKTKLGAVVVADNIPKGQEYVAGSAKINNAADSNGFKYKSAADGDEEKTGTLTYTFNNEINDIYEITFRTKITDESIFYTNGQKTVKNKAVITGDVIPPNVSTVAEKKIENIVINKSADYKSGNDYIDWKILINSNSTPMGKVDIQDILQEGLTLDTLSVELYNGILNSQNGNIIKGDKVLVNKDNFSYDINTREFIFKFDNEVNSPYILTFRTDIVDKSKQPFTNKANFKGSKTSQTSSTNPTYVEFQSGGGGAIGTRGTININKVDKDSTNKSLKGAKYNLLDKDMRVIATGETDGNGNLTFNRIRFEIPYYVEEITPPEGYVLDSTRHEFTIKSADDIKNISKTLYNNIIKGSIELYKVDDDMKPLKGVEFTLYDSKGDKVISSESNDKGIVTFNDIPYGNYTVKETSPLEGYLKNDTIYSFDIKEDGKTVKAENSVENKIIRGNIKVVKVDEDNNLLANAEITLYDLEGNEIQKDLTDENGQVIFKNIPYGDYEVKETKAPEGYNLSDKVIKVSVNKEETGLVYEAGRITNTKIKANIKINKLDQDNNKIVGAEFTLYDKNDKPITTAVTNGDGIALFEDVIYGDYYIKETKTPEGYVLNSYRHDFTINENGAVLKETVINEQIVGDIKVVKIDEDKNLLANAEITLYDLEDNIVQKAVTDANGLVILVNVPYGEYKVKETRAPEGYNLSKEVLKVSVNKEDTGLVYEAGTITNTKIKANIKINKLDQDNNKIVGAEFTLYDKNDKPITTAVTNTDGIALFENVVYGDYYIKETKTPEGYIGTNEKIEVSVKENNLVYSYEIENARIKAKIEINKIDENGEPLKGAEFTLLSKDGKEISKAVSNENGVVIFEAVDYGNYAIKETKAPEGYLKEDTEVEVVVDSQKTQVFTFKNIKIKDETANLGKGGLPSTGDAFDSRLLLIVGALLVLTGRGFMIKRKVKLNK
ncbi:SpaA isopeptide-forming pilin-related protein [Clostridium sp.]|uniref:SpaA isopeptide-forming pilin-related protein n=1 Tax=Clostridium sp. TaxID=1506 RepID=UPI00345D7E77